MYMFSCDVVVDRVAERRLVETIASACFLPGGGIPARAGPALFPERLRHGADA